MISRTWASSLSCAALMAEGSTTFDCIELLRSGGFNVHFGNFIRRGARRVVKSVKVRVRLDVHDAVGDDGRSVDWSAEVRPILLAAVDRDFAQDFLFFRRGEHHEVAVLIPDINLAVSDKGGAPHVGFHVMDPIDLAVLCIQTMHEAGKISNK